MPEATPRRMIVCYCNRWCLLTVVFWCHLAHWCPGRSSFRVGPYVPWRGRRGRSEGSCLGVAVTAQSASSWRPSPFLAFLWSLFAPGHPAPVWSTHPNSYHTWSMLARLVPSALCLRWCCSSAESLSGFEGSEHSPSCGRIGCFGSSSDLGRRSAPGCCHHLCRWFLWCFPVKGSFGRRAWRPSHSPHLGTRAFLLERQWLCWRVCWLGIDQRHVKRSHLSDAWRPFWPSLAASLPFLQEHLMVTCPASSYGSLYGKLTSSSTPFWPS